MKNSFLIYIKNSPLSLIDWRFLGRFLLIFVPLYYFNLFFWGITDPKNFYSPFLDHHFNYIALITASILHTSNLFIHLFGIPSVVTGNTIFVLHGPALQMAAPCVGMGIMLFWIAFIVAGRSSFQKKIYWCAGGVAAIWFINCCRVSLLLYSLQNNWNIGKYVDAHDMFNYTAYGVILVFIWLESNSAKKHNAQLGLNRV